MYCSNCSQPLNGNLNYCNSCGTRVERNAALAPAASPRALAICAVAVLGAGGLVGILPLLKVLLDSRLDQPAVLLLLIAYLATVLAMFSITMVFVWKNPAENRVRPGKRSDGYAAPRSLRQADTAQLVESHQRPASVTEHTTRTLEHVPLRD